MNRSSLSFFSITDKIRLATLFLAILLFSSCGAKDQKTGEGAGGLTADQPPATAVQVLMGTVAQITLYGGGEEDCRRLLQQAADLEEELLSAKNNTSQIAILNAGAAAADLHSEIPAELEELLRECERISERSGGAFDVTMGALTGLWRMDEIAAGQAPAIVPSKQEIEAARSQCGADKVTLSKNGIFMKQGVRLDLGSVGKGYALDCIARTIRQEESLSNLRGGVVALGGSILTFGEKEEGVPWRVGIADPENAEAVVGYLELSGEWFVSTSGDYERFFEAEGERMHHILDPETGYPAKSGLRSVTILAKNGTLSDALSTACFVLGKEKGAELAEAEGAYYLMLGENGELWRSESLAEFFHSAK